MASEIKTYSTSLLLKDVWKEINNLVQENIIKGTLPYLVNKPYPQDSNLVITTHLGDINKIELELTAASIGAKSLEWIFEADAEMIGLELKENATGIILTANVNRNNKVQEEPHCAFLLDQFTEESRNRLYNINEFEKYISTFDNETKKFLRTVAHKVIKNIDEYNRGANEFDLINQKKENLRQNLENNFLKQKVLERTEELTSNYDSNQKIIFDHLQNYYLKQLTGFGTYKLTPEEKEKILKSFKELSVVDTPRLVKVLADSFLLSERKTHYEFAQEKIYSLADKNKKLTVIAPVAVSKKENITQEKNKSPEKLRDRDKSLKPQHTRRK